MGQTGKAQREQMLSAWPLKPDIAEYGRHVRLVPTDIPNLFDHFVSARKERWRYGEAKRFCGLKINR